MINMSNKEDIEILENSLLTIKQISSLVNELENFYNNSKESPDGLTKRQAQILIYLLQLPNPPSIRELSRLISTSHQNIKQICTRLEDNNLITFIEDFKDKRKIRIKLTLKGESKAYNVNKSLIKISNKIASNFNSDEIDELARLLRKLQFSVDNENYTIRKTYNN